MAKKSTQEKPTKEVYSIQIKNPRNVYSLYTSEFASLNPDNLKFYFECARKGLNLWVSLLFEDIRKKDLHIGGICYTRKMGILGKNMRIKKNLDSFISCENEEHKKFIVDNFKKINLINFITDIIESQIQGVSIFDLTYEICNDKIYLNEIRLIPNHLVVYDDLQDKYLFLDDEDILKLRSYGNDYSEDRIDLKKIKTIEIPEEKLLEVHSIDGNYQNGFLNGCHIALIWGYLFKSYDIKDMQTYLEKFAVPPVVGKYDSLAGKTEKEQFKNCVRNFGSDMWMIMSKDFELEFPSDGNKSVAIDLFLKPIEYFDSKMSIRVLGQTQTTEIGKDEGSRASAGIHNTVREDYIIADMLIVEEHINSLIKKLIDLNYSNVSEYPTFEFPETKSLGDKKVKAEIYSVLKEVGYKPTPEQISQDLDMDLEEAKEVLEDNSGQKLIEAIKRIRNFSDATIDEHVNNFLKSIWETSK